MTQLTAGRFVLPAKSTKHDVSIPKILTDYPAFYHRNCTFYTIRWKVAGIRQSEQFPPLIDNNSAYNW